MTETNGKDQQNSTNILPPGYTSLTPLLAEKHQDLRYTPLPTYEFAKSLHAVPLVADEFPRAQLSFPIVFTKNLPRLPVGMLSAQSGANEYVADGKWKDGEYVPAYLRRYPFALVKESMESDRMLLCADLTAPQFAESNDGMPLFDGQDPSNASKQVIEFCRHYEASVQRTRQLVDELEKLQVFEDSSVKIQKGEKSARVEGFALVSEKLLRELGDTELASLARRGVIGLVAAHQFSINQFSGVMKDSL